MKIAEAMTFQGEADSYARQESIWLLEHILQLNSFQMQLKQEQVLTTEQVDAFLQGLARIASGEPLAYVIGSQPFWTLDLKVTRDTLVPRPDTEILVETVLKLELPNYAKVLDLGTGTGAIALSLASERPAWEVTATDIYAPTLEVAKFNAVQHNLNQVKFKCGAWYQALDAVHMFDLIVSNPPYIDPDDHHMAALETEPRRALVADKQGLADLETIISEGKHRLSAQGWLAVEHGYNQAEAVQRIFRDNGFQKIRTVKDYGGNDRVSLACKLD